MSTAVKRYKFSEGGLEAEERKRKWREELKRMIHEMIRLTGDSIIA